MVRKIRISYIKCLLLSCYFFEKHEGTANSRKNDDPTSPTGT